MRLLRSAWPWLGGAAALALADALLVFDGVNQWDESWTLQVVQRVSEGEALYRDVAFGTTPLSVYLLWAIVQVVGHQVFAIKLLAALLAAGSGLLVARIALQGGVSRLVAVLCAVLTLPLAPAVQGSLYTPLAMFFLLACESVTLTIPGRDGSRRAAMAGVVAGLAFAAKQNVGGLAFLALVVVLLFAEPVRAGIHKALAAGAAFAAMVVATVSTMVAIGGVRNALDALGLGKGAYLELGAVPYHDALRSQLRTITTPDAWANVVAGHDRDLLVASPKVLLPVVTGLVLLAAWAAWARRGSRPRRPDVALVTVTAFAGASFLAAFPRYDVVHLASIGGALVAACAVSLTRILPHSGRALRALAGVVALGWAGFVLAGPIDDWSSGSRVRVGLPHFAVTWTSPDARTHAAATVRRLQDALPGRRVFIAIGNASFYYLAAGLENPTPFDYPAPTTLGHDEVERVLEGVADGSVPVVCLVEGSANPFELRPLELERRLRRVLRPGRDVGLCRLWLPS